MANHNSARKATRQAIKRTVINKNNNSRIKTYIKKFIQCTQDNNDLEQATEALRKAQSEIFKGVSKGLIKKNTAARKVSRMAARLKALNS